MPVVTSKGAHAVKHLTAAAITLSAIALTATACSSSTKSGTAAPATGSTPAASTPSTPSGSGTGVTVGLTHTSLGTFLVDGQGHTLYLFEKDTGHSSTCDGACASAWPPATTTGMPHAAAGVNAALLGTTTRADHSVEITYNGHPLYTFTGDSKPGATNGEGSKAFGAGWYVVTPSGSKIDNS